MKNIGVICYPTFGGSGIVASELGRGLSQKYNIHFISYKKPVKLNLLSHNIFYHKVNIPEYPLFEYPPYELALSARIVEVVKKYNINLLHVHYAIPHAYSAINAQQILLENNIKIPIITTLHGTDITLVGKSPFVMSAVNYAINKSSLVTCVSEDLKLKTLEYFDIEHNIKVIPNFIDFHLKTQPKIVLKKKKIITHISNFRPVKRILDVISIFCNIYKKCNCELIMIGDGPDLEKAKKMVKLKGLNSSVNFVGKSKNVDALLKKTDLFLLPSETESFGLVALEAMSFGVPVICTDSGGIRELILDGESGYTFKVGDVNAMSNKAVSLLSDRNLYRKISQGSYERAKKYDMKKIIPLYEDCYEKLML